MAGRVDAAVTAAFRRGTREAVVAALTDEAARNAGFRDYRDVLLSFAPFFDAARRLELGPTDVFDAAAADVPDDVAELLRVFGRRSDVTLGAFGWVWDDGMYRFGLRGNRA